MVSLRHVHKSCFVFLSCGAELVFSAFVRQNMIAFIYVVSSVFQLDSLEPRGSHYCLGRGYTFPTFFYLLFFFFLGVFVSDSGALLFSLF